MLVFTKVTLQKSQISVHVHVVNLVTLQAIRSQSIHYLFGVLFGMVVWHFCVKRVCWCVFVMPHLVFGGVCMLQQMM